MTTKLTRAEVVRDLLGFFEKPHYLEIGVSRGLTFHAVTAERKVAIDPRFHFDVDEARTAHPEAEYHSVTSDTYFATIARPQDRFDVIYLDGLHTFEQTLRDFCAAQRHCHDNTIWLIDDTIPADIFSAHPNRVTSLKHRRLYGAKGRAWHGDVFKTVFAIHDFFLNFTYKTISTALNPQTVMIRRPRSEFKPLFNDLERISRMDYYDFHDYRHILNLESEERVFNWVRALIQGGSGSAEAEGGMRENEAACPVALGTG